MSDVENPVWQSLSEIHQDYAIVYDGIKFYKPEYCPFGGASDIHNATKGISKYCSLTDDFFVVGSKPLASSLYQINQELVCNQMHLSNSIDINIQEEITELVSDSQKQELFDLVNLVQPGYYRKKTAELGTYFGIYKSGKLVAATGERMKTKNFTEISAVVTHPDYTGNGYAKQLLKQTADHILAQDKIAYLHVYEGNTGAIKLYEKLGFTTKRKMSFWNLKSTPEVLL